MYKRQRIMKKEEKEVQKLKEEIISLLKTMEVYSPAFDILIESAVQLTLLRNKSFKNANKGNSTITEVSRENDKRVRANPAYHMYIEINKELRAVLGELNLTIKSSLFSEGDELDKLNRKIDELKANYGKTNS